MIFEYLGTYHGALLVRKGGVYYQQSDDGALSSKWREFRITKTQAEAIMAMGRTEYDVVFAYNDTNIPPPADSPIWKTHQIEYLTWHRNNDPPPYLELAAAALSKVLDQ